MPRTVTIAALTVLCAACALAQVAEPIASGPPPVEELAAEAERLYDEWRWNELKAISLRMVTHYPESAGSWYWRGNAHSGEKEHGHARRAYQRAVEIDPDHLLARQELVVLTAVLGRPGEREESPTGLFIYTEAQAEAAAELVEYCGEILADDPQNRDALLVRAEALRCMDDDAGSLAELRHAAELCPNDPEVLWKLEVAMDNTGGSDEERIRLLERSLELAPRRMRTLSSLTYTHYRLDQHDLALQTFERMKRVNPACEAGYTGAGLVYAYGLHDMERSLQQYDIAIALKPTDDEVGRGKMHAIRHFGDPADALKTIDEAIAAGIPESRWLHDRGMIYLSMGRYDDAVAEYTRALELGIEATRRQDLMLYWLRARAQMYAERYEEAWADLHRGQGAGMNDDMFEALAEELREHMPEPEREGEG